MTICQRQVPLLEKGKGILARGQGKPRPCGALAVKTEPAVFTMCAVHAKLAGYDRCRCGQVWIGQGLPLCSTCALAEVSARG